MKMDVKKVVRKRNVLIAAAAKSYQTLEIEVQSVRNTPLKLSPEIEMWLKLNVLLFCELFCRVKVTVTLLLFPLV